MSKTAIGIAALFLGLALFQAASGLFASDPAPPPPPPQAATPSPSPEPSLSPKPAKPPKLKPFPTFAGPAPEPKTYEDTEALAAALADRGIECTTLDFLDQPDPTLSEFSLCDPGTPNRRFNIYFYETEENRALWLGLMKEQKLPLPLVYGPNWIVVAAGEPSTAMKRIEAIRGAIGGEIKDFSPKS
ncbi:MAG: hypothetical protein M3N53_05650 [Actinomycetota bacterium]|nr:hypothetical protein [Actinomycetota bacterium]